MAIRGFTLLEVIAAVTIISVLLFIAVPYGHDIYVTQEKAQVLNTLKLMRKALKNYSTDHNGAYPRKLTGLVEKDYLRSIPDNILTDLKDWHIARRVYEPGSVQIATGVSKEIAIRKYVWIRSTDPGASTDGWADYRFCLPRTSEIVAGKYADPPDSGSFDTLDWSFWGICNVRSSVSLGIDEEEDIYGSIEVIAASSTYDD